MEKAIWNVKTNPGGTIFNRPRQSLSHADDVAVLRHAVKYVAGTAEDMTTVALQIGLSINVSKTKYMVSSKKKKNEPQEIVINWQKYESVEMFKH
jgi:hypothetical protein